MDDPSVAGAGPIFGLVALAGVIFFLPTIVGAFRHVERPWLLFALNVIAGGTGIFWPVAMLWAVIMPTTRPMQPVQLPPLRYRPGDPQPPDTLAWLAFVERGGDPNKWM
jgi:Superinfection immunity protein